MKKQELITLIDFHKPKEKVFKVDQCISSFGHTVVRLPPYMCDLNAIEFAWAQVKNYVRDRNCDGNLSLSRLTQLAEEAEKSVTVNDWVDYCRKVVETERKYWTNDGIVSDAIDNFIISFGEDSENDSDASDSEKTITDYGSDSDDLAQPIEHH